MKKTLSFILVMLLVFGLFACSSSESAPASTQAVTTAPQETEGTTGLMAGFGRVDISPTAPIGMGGYGDKDTRLSGAILDNIYATCVALKLGEDTFLVFTVDVIAAGDTVANTLRGSVSEATGVPQEHILVGATHTHSAPEWNGGTSSGCVAAAKIAMEDMAPASLEMASAELDNMNFVRHYLMNDGTYYGSNFGSDESGFKAHALEVDNQISLLKLERGDKKGILMINWQAHPAAAARQVDYTGVSADFVGYTRKKIELETGLQVAYYTGASGNVNPRSLIETENTNNNTNFQSYGATLGEKVIALLPTLTPVEVNGTSAAYSHFPVEVDHSWDHMAVQASEVVGAWKNQSLEAGHELAREYGLSSAYHANSILNRSALKGQQYRDLYAFRLGPIGFINNTYETFCDHGAYVKEQSPFDMTFVITGCSGYIANEASYGYRSYESDTCPYVIGTGEALAEEMARLLNTLK